MDRAGVAAAVVVVAGGVRGVCARARLDRARRVDQWARQRTRQGSGSM